MEPPADQENHESRTQPETGRHTVGDLARRARHMLTAAGSPTAALDAEVLIRDVLDLDRSGYFLAQHDLVPPPAAARIAALVQRATAGEPIAYLTGRREFRSYRFRVGPGVLVPRPETELLVDWARDWLESRTRAVVCDVGTGSGAIVLSLASELADRDIRWMGIDNSAAALAFAAHNRQALSLTDRVHLVQADLLSSCRGPVDLVLANLPYLTTAQIAEQRELAWEPPGALDGGDQGLAAIRRLIAQASDLLDPKGAIALEIDPSQASETRRLLTQAFPNALVDVVPDLAGLARLATADRSEPSILGDI